MFKYLLMVIFGLLIYAAPAAALDPACDPNDPAFNPFDVTSGPYVRDQQDVRFCAPHQLVDGTPLVDPVSCSVFVGGTEYAQAQMQPGDQMLVSVNETSGPSSVRCTTSILWTDGNTYFRISSVNFDYVAVPVSEPPTILAQ
jgi:hypothetical protein